MAAAGSGRLIRPVSGLPVSAERPRYLVVLAAAFVVTTFFNAIRLSNNPLAENPMNVAGVLLAGTFALTRFTAARLWVGPTRLFWVFICISAALELGRLFADPGGDGFSSLRQYAQYVQAFLVYLIFYDLARDRGAAETVLRTYLVAVILLSLVANTGLGGVVGAAQVGRGDAAERVGVLGMNLNYQAFLYGAAITGVVCRTLARWPRFGPWDWILLGGAASMLLALLRTGSRGGLLVLVAGLTAALALMFRGRRWAAYVLLVPPALYGIGSAIMSSEVTQARIEQTLYEGRLGMRDVLAREASTMVAEKPVFGWGVRYTEELGLRVGRQRIAAHNTFLQITASFGLLGFVPWALGLGFTGWRLWRHRADFWAATLLALFGALLVAMVPGNYGYNPTAWILFALAGAMPFAPPPPVKRPRGAPIVVAGVRRPLPGRSVPLRSGAGSTR